MANQLPLQLYEQVDITPGSTTEMADGHSTFCIRELFASTAID